uniref:Low molecular weight protein-tyrosine-phosphatase slr0328 n=1 Tax=Arundo donax TaxID=35708 RepID=A0A0A9DYC4_ARUDO
MISNGASRVYMKLGVKSTLAYKVPEHRLSCRTPANVPEANEEDGKGLRLSSRRRRRTRLRSHPLRRRRESRARVQSPVGTGEQRCDAAAVPVTMDGSELDKWISLAAPSNKRVSSCCWVRS